MKAQIALAVVVAALAGCDETTVRQKPASTADIRAFVLDAERGFAGSFALTYDVTVGGGRGAARRMVVSAVQHSAESFAYRTTPSLELTGPGGRPAGSSYEVFVQPPGPHGTRIYSCRKERPFSPWRCEGPYTDLGMGGTWMLLGPYPPKALLLGLQNAVAVYTDRPAVAPLRHQPAFLTTRRVSGQILRCLTFGRAPHRLGHVCLWPSGVISSYALPGTASSAAYETATLRAFSRHVRASEAIGAAVKSRRARSVLSLVAYR